MRRRGLFRNRNSVIITPNTFIGGVAYTIPDAATLATKLGILESDISYFTVNGSDIEAIIDTDYTIPENAFNSDNNITFYLDSEGKCTSISRNSFEFSNISNCHFPSVTYIDVYAFRNSKLTGDITFPSVLSMQFRGTFRGTNINILSLPELTEIIGGNNPDSPFGYPACNKLEIPKCTVLGIDAGYNDIFKNFKTGGEIVCPSSLATANIGSEEGDVAYARNTLGCTITYV